MRNLFSRTANRNQAIDILDQLEVLLTAGFPLDRALISLMESLQPSREKDIVACLLNDIQKGASLTEAMAQHRSVFNEIEINMIKAAETSGVLPRMLKTIVGNNAAAREFKRFLLASSIYPLILLAFGFSAVAGIVVFILPRFAEAYPDLSTASPVLGLLLNISISIDTHGWIYLAAMLSIAALPAYLFRQPTIRAWAEDNLLQLPMVGQIIIRAELAKLLSTLSILLNAGVPILTALKLSGNLTRYPRIATTFAAVERSVRNGTGFSRPLLGQPLFPRLLGQMAAVGEESGNLGTLLMRASERFENEVRSHVRTSLALLEPVLILLIGLIIGSIVIAMLAAIFSLNELPL